MSSDTSSKAPIDPIEEVDKEKSLGKPEDNKSSSKDKKNNDQHEKE
jgi:hypothetical protein